jgi:hypothetical protein
MLIMTADLAMSRDNLRPSLVYTGNTEQYTALEQNIEAGIGQCQSLAQIQHLEVSLLPKPYKLHSRLNASLKSILEVLIEIRTLRLSIPRRETVLDVLPLRQDLVSLAKELSCDVLTPVPGFFGLYHSLRCRPRVSLAITFTSVPSVSSRGCE